MNQEQLIWHRVREGDVQALNTLYDLYVDKLYAYGMKLTSKSYLVKDAIHDLFLDLYKYRKNLSEVSNIEGYLIISFKRKLVKLIKNDYRNKEDVSKDVFHTLYTDSEEYKILKSETAKEQSHRLSNALQKLPSKQREILFFRFYDDKDYDEISQLMGISVTSARTQVYRAIKTLRSELNGI
ncbi:sigma-70 family RNA polymerase sigma factor [Galbibacter sp. PAP.153]|uniref:RNA polymerase sigma factor n=1 Tax=Galbibacter sp. PAP.153 TaxID=3104623 RepID=UPI00300BCEF4